MLQIVMEWTSDFQKVSRFHFIKLLFSYLFLFLSLSFFFIMLAWKFVDFCIDNSSLWVDGPSTNFFVRVSPEQRSQAIAASHARASMTTDEFVFENQKRFLELDIACIVTIGTLLDGHHFFHSSSLPASPSPSSIADDSFESDGSSFVKFFTFLSRYLAKSKEDQDQYRELRVATMRALTALLKANLSHALHDFLKMAYFGDERTRGAFLVVLASALREVYFCVFV